MKVARIKGWCGVQARTTTIFVVGDMPPIISPFIPNCTVYFNQIHTKKNNTIWERKFKAIGVTINAGNFDAFYPTYQRIEVPEEEITPDMKVVDSKHL